MRILKSKIEELLGCGLSVETITARLGITYEDLCKVANENPALLSQLKSWYKRYDFSYTPKKQDKSLEVKEKTPKKAKKKEEKIEVE